MPMIKHAPDLAQPRRVRISNIWLFEPEPGVRVLIDTGHRLERRPLARFLKRAGVRRPGDLDAIILTHRHSDHAGNAAWLRRQLECPLICHSHDAPALTGKRAPERLLAHGPRWNHRFMCLLEDTFPSRAPVDERFEVGPWRMGFTVYPAYGHTECSVMLHHAPSQTLFTGDAILTGVPPFRIFERFGLAVSSFCLDVDACHQHAVTFASEPPPVRRICPGHGAMISKDVESKLRHLAANPVEAIAP